MPYWNATAVREMIHDWDRRPDTRMAAKVRRGDAALIMKWAIERCDEWTWGRLTFPLALELFVAAAQFPKARPQSGERRSV